MIPISKAHLYGARTIDETPDGERQGGSVTYSELVYQLCGLPCQVHDEVPEIRFRNTYDPHEVRTQSARRDDLTALDPTWEEGALVHLMPVLGEVSIDASFPDSKPSDAVLAINIQGWTRQAGIGEWSAVRPKRWSPVGEIDVLFFSREDVEDLASFWSLATSHARIVIETCGSEGAIVWCNNETFRVGARSVNVVDPTGAGDVFASAFCASHFYFGHDLDHSARFASAFASAVISGEGTDGLSSLTVGDVEGWTTEVEYV